MARAANWPVTVPNDVYDGVCDAHCSLRDGAAAANANPGDDTIIIPSGMTVTLQRPGTQEDGNLNGDVDLWDAAPSTLIIRSSTPGSRATLTVAGTEERILHVIDASATLHLTLVDLHLTSASTVPTGPTRMGGGCVANEHAGQLTVQNTMMEACMYLYVPVPPGARGGGAIDSIGPVLVEDGAYFLQNQSAGPGGAIFAGGAVTADSAWFIGNQALYSTVRGQPSDGGAIYTEAGPVAVSDSTFESNIAEGRGGAIAMPGNGGALSITGSPMAYNTARRPVGVSGGVYASGGAVYARQRAVTVTSSTLWSNQATSATLDEPQGGAIDVDGGSLTVSQSSFQDHTVSGRGGAVIVTNGSLSVFTSKFINNQAIEVTLATSSPKGGAVYATNSTFYVADSEFDNNRVEGKGAPRGGAVFVTAPSSDAVLAERSAFLGNSALDPTTDPNQARGGAIVIDQGTSTFTATLRNNTFSGNSADEGGAIYNQRDGTTAGHDLDLEYCTFVENNANIASVLLTDVVGDVTFYNSVIHEPPSPTIDPCSGPAGSIVTGDGNYLDRPSYAASTSSTCDFNAGSGGGDADDSPTPGSFDPLNSYGTPTQIHRLVAGHPAFGLAPCLGTVAEDQHGAPRATSGACDSGSWEAP